jgi:hypothetical protein
MKRTQIALAAAALIVVALGPAARLFAQAPADHAAIEKTLVANEQKVIEAFAKKDVATLKTVIADDAVGVDMGGVNPVVEMYKQMPTMDMKVTEQHMSDFKYLWVNATTVVLSYTWTGKGTMMGQPLPSPTYASTVYTKRGANWMAVFHQETAAMPAPKK